MQCLVSFADRSGRCWPSCRTFATFAAARHLAGLVEAGVATRKRRPGRGYEYEIDPRFLPRASVSHQQDQGVPSQTRQETDTEKQTKERARPRFTNRGVSFGELPNDRAKWEARLRSWRKSRFWLPLWGAKPGEAGCMVPAALMTG
jgi:hypothetical protein